MYVQSRASDMCAGSASASRAVVSRLATNGNNETGWRFRFKRLDSINRRVG